MLRDPLHCLSLGLGLFTVLGLAQDKLTGPSTRTISFPTSRPSDAVIVPPDFVGFGFDSAFLNSYANDFSNNLVDSIASRMSARPIIRSGGTSGYVANHTRDRPQRNAKRDITAIELHSTQTKKFRPIACGPCPNGSGAYFVLGPSYFDGLNSFKNARFSIQAPLSLQLNVSNPVKFVRHEYDVLGEDRLAAIAIGNEVSHYEQTAGDYVHAVKAFEQNINEALNLTGSSAIVFEVADLASEAVTTGKRGNCEFRHGEDRKLSMLLSVLTKRC